MIPTRKLQSIAKRRNPADVPVLVEEVKKLQSLLDDLGYMGEHITIDENGEEHTQHLISLARDITCIECGELHLESYMLLDDVWLREVKATKEQVACLPCAQRRAGRILTADDLIDAPVNIGLKLMFKNGQQSGMSKQ